MLKYWWVPLAIIFIVSIIYGIFMAKPDDPLKWLVSGAILLMWGFPFFVGLGLCRMGNDTKSTIQIVNKIENNSLSDLKPIIIRKIQWEGN
jgi:ABC-type dipeptide/oligopeptide/nickel transport system permease component